MWLLEIQKEILGKICEKYMHSNILSKYEYTNLHLTQSHEQTHDESLIYVYESFMQKSKCANK